MIPLAVFIVDDEELYNETKDYVARNSTRKTKIVKLYQSKDFQFLRNTT
jgi:Ribonuclease G/E